MDRVETHVGTVAYRRAGAGAPLVLLHGGLSTLDTRAHARRPPAAHLRRDGRGHDRAAALDVAPDPGAFPALVEKIRALNRGFKGWAASDIESIQAPIMLSWIVPMVISFLEAE